MEKLFDKLALQQMPSNMQSLDQKKNGLFCLNFVSLYIYYPFIRYLQCLIIAVKYTYYFFLFLVPKPNLDSYVFIKVNEKVDQATMDPE